LKRAPKKTEEQGPKVPGYIVTFSDMVTLLLTFFVMLLSLADVQDPELFDKGRDSFIESLRYVGLGALIGRQHTINLGSLKNKYAVPEPEQTSNNRSIDVGTEELNRIFQQLKESMITLTSQISTEKANFSVADVHFSPGTSVLDQPSKTFLREFCRDLTLSTNGKSGMLYVLGLAPDEKTEKEQWIISAQRAETVAGFLRDNLILAGNLQKQFGLDETAPMWSVHSWGAGPGGVWAGPDSLMSKRSQILIAVLR
jgi:chemotaxis protein MotB